jgi:hypothetical protein
LTISKKARKLPRHRRSRRNEDKDIDARTYHIIRSRTHTRASRRGAGYLRHMRCAMPSEILGRSKDYSTVGLRACMRLLVRGEMLPIAKMRAPTMGEKIG